MNNKEGCLISHYYAVYLHKLRLSIVINCKISQIPSAWNAFLAFSRHQLDSILENALFILVLYNSELLMNHSLFQRLSRIQQQQLHIKKLLCCRHVLNGCGVSYQQSSSQKQRKFIIYQCDLLTCSTILTAGTYPNSL